MRVVLWLSLLGSLCFGQVEDSTSASIDNFTVVSIDNSTEPVEASIEVSVEVEAQEQPEDITARSVTVEKENQTAFQANATEATTDTHIPPFFQATTSNEASNVAPPASLQGETDKNMTDTEIVPIDTTTTTEIIPVDTTTTETTEDMPLPEASLEAIQPERETEITEITPIETTPEAKEGETETETEIKTTTTNITTINETTIETENETEVGVNTNKEAEISLENETSVEAVSIEFAESAELLEAKAPTPDVIDRAHVLPPTPDAIPGHKEGSCPSADTLWCASLKKCVRAWVEPCPASDQTGSMTDASSTTERGSSSYPGSQPLYPPPAEVRTSGSTGSCKCGEFCSGGNGLCQEDGRTCLTRVPSC